MSTGHVIVYQAPWNWEFLWNRSQPLAVALSAHCTVVYLGTGVCDAMGLHKWAGKALAAAPHPVRRLAARLQWSYPQPSAAGPVLWQWSGVPGDARVLTVEDRPRHAYDRLAAFLRGLEATHHRFDLLTSRPQAVGLTHLRRWDRVIVDIEDPWLEFGWGAQLDRDAIRDALQRADLVTANGSRLTEEYGAFAGRQVHNLPNGIDGEFLAKLQQPLPIPPFYQAAGPRRRVVFTGNINNRFDFARIAAVVGQLPNHRFFFVGPANVPHASRAEWAAIVGQENVTWVPPVAHAEIPAILQHAHLLWLPYTQAGSRQMFPAKLLEYMAAAKPILSTLDFQDATLAIPSLRVCADHESLVAALAEDGRGGGLAEAAAAQCRQLAAQHSWQARAAEFMRLL